jgi:hypothetical protein
MLRGMESISLTLWCLTEPRLKDALGALTVLDETTIVY